MKIEVGGIGGTPKIPGELVETVESPPATSLPALTAGKVLRSGGTYAIVGSVVAAGTAGTAAAAIVVVVGIVIIDGCPLWFCATLMGMRNSGFVSGGSSRTGIRCR